MFIDTHIHLDSKEYENDLEEVLSKAGEKEVEYCINPGSDLRSLDTIPRISEKYPQILPAYGIHPHDAKDFNDNLYSKIKTMLQEKAVAVGETGLDFHYNFSEPQIQKEVFLKHINLSKEFDLPLIIHSRKAEEDIYNLLKKENMKKGVIHCYSGSLEYAEKFINLGFYIGITGVVTFPKAENIRDIVKNIPLERILTETDGPYMAPVPHRGKRNLPEYIPFIAEKITQIKEKNLEVIQGQLFENAKDLFGF
ncbi:MAG: TatD family hydrolase [Armatimonadota bacterium]